MPIPTRLPHADLATLLDGTVQVTLTRAAVVDLLSALGRSLTENTGEVHVVLDVCEHVAWLEVRGTSGPRIGGAVTHCYCVINN